MTGDLPRPAAATLRWATGRIVLPGREPVTSWRWHCARLDEWDGAVPRWQALPPHVLR